MRRALLFAVPLVLCSAPLLLAQQQSPNTPAPAQPQATPVAAAPADSAKNPAMTPRQEAQMRAELFMARKEYSEAAGAYQNLLKDDPKNAWLMNMLGVSYQMLDEPRKSEHYYRLAMKTDKTFASPVNNLGTLQYGRKHYGKAIGLYQKALPLSSDRSVVFSNLGYAYFANKEYPEAMDCFGKALALDAHIFDHKSGNGSIIQQRTTTDPGLFYFLVAKTYALAGDAERTAHYLKLARDDGYKDIAAAEKDPAFAKVIKDPAVREVLETVPAYANEPKKSNNN
ncbi:MAG TPA: tetratricopeptide repeat protein [Candidatus Limnocylindrales bacterium]|nr:tetratricopeptide repeat protein [Candidatus Limnocylindrales bacterium]